MNSEIRIQKVLSENGVLSRRKAEEAVVAGRVTVNGRPALVGQKVNPSSDIIAIDGNRLTLKKSAEKIYIMMNKPRGYLSTVSDDRGRKTVVDLLKGFGTRVYPVGRLDLNSEGLLLLTNDGDMANSIMHPSNEISKTYRVTVRGNINEQMLIDLSSGVVLDDGHKTAPATLHVLEKQADRDVVQFTVHEGRNRLIRRMCQAVGLDVIRLKRGSIGPIKLGMLAPGEWRVLKPIELTALRNAVNKAVNRALSKQEEDR